ncbi:MAG TPA: ATP-binding cassette domain-containing protein [Ideonella sp.]|nr:ATP-binding cassette domain-containing protein [Ideonella sp.]
MIRIKDLHYAWARGGPDCIAIPALHISAGSTVFLHGPSGGGKSTLLGLLAGVLLPQQGEVSVMGQSWKALSGAQRDRFRADHVGYIFQQFNLLSYLSVLDNVLLPCRVSPLRQERAVRDGGSTVAQAQRLLQHVGLDEALWDRPALQLSVGQQQRVAAARALIGRPELVIADEPTSALDAPLRDGFMALLLRECEAAGSTLVFVSHDERLAGRFQSRLALSTINAATSRAAEANA